jgi:hypothetical protein
MRPTKPHPDQPIPTSKESSMRHQTSYMPKAVAMLGAAAITSLTLYVHAADRTQLGAPAAPLHSTFAHSPSIAPATSPGVAKATVTLVATRHE